MLRAHVLLRASLGFSEASGPTVNLKTDILQKSDKGALGQDHGAKTRRVSKAQEN